VGRLVADLGRRVVGVDFSERSVALAARANPRLGFIAADVRALPFAGGACAGILAFYSLIYGGAEPTASALAELRRVLQPGGRLLVAVHAGDEVQRFTDYKGTPIDVEIHLREPGTFARWVREAGFEIDAVEVRAPYPFEHPAQRLYVAGRAR
jgi:SAM-dependent methyltransferase